MAAKRLTRKEMVRQDRIQQTLTETSGWLVRNLSYILAAIAVVLVSLVAAYLWTSYQQSVETELQTRFSDALAKYHATVSEELLEDSAGGQTPQAPETKYEYATKQERSESALAAFEELSEEYSGSRLGALSQYYRGLALIDLEKPDEAKTALSSIISDSEFPDIANLARNSLVQLAVSEGSEQEAIRLLKEILDQPSLNFPEQLVLTRLAQSYEAVGEYEEALRSYRKLSAEYAGTSFANKSDARIKYLELRGVTNEEEEAPEEEDPSSETQE